MEEYINGITDYIDKITASKSIKELSRSPFLYRGQSNKEYSLLPSLGRNRESPYSTSLFNKERDLIEMACCRLPQIFTRSLYPLERLALMQHYGLPTRLLDVTANALVALYFACCQDDEKEGEVIVFNNKPVSSNSPYIEAIADSNSLIRGTYVSVKEFVNNMLEMPYLVTQKAATKALLEADEETMQKAFYCHEIGEYFNNMLQMPLFVCSGRYKIAKCSGGTKSPN